MLWTLLPYGVCVGVAHISLCIVWAMSTWVPCCLKCLGICTDGFHISLCIVWVVSVLVLLDVISWVRVPVLVYVL